MKKRRMLYVAAGLLAGFILWTVLVRFVDVRAIGPRGSYVGFSALNGYIHHFTGVNMLLYTITDWLGAIPLCFALGFAVLGLGQWIKRKNILKVDRGILALGGFLAAVAVVYIFFEIFIVNYRPVLINGYLEASYPSSTAMLSMCVMPACAILLCSYIKGKTKRKCVCISVALFVAFMVLGRFLSGVHWFSDIIGGALISTGLVMLFYVIYNELKKS